MQISKDKGDDEFMKDYNNFSLFSDSKCGNCCHKKRQNEVY